jgi:hypothetical protein
MLFHEEAVKPFLITANSPQKLIIHRRD